MDSLILLQFIIMLAVWQGWLDSLVIDSSKIRRELGWTPPFTMVQGLAETAEWLQGSGGRA